MAVEEVEGEVLCETPGQGVAVGEGLLLRELVAQEEPEGGAGEGLAAVVRVGSAAEGVAAAAGGEGEWGALALALPLGEAKEEALWDGRALTLDEAVSTAGVPVAQAQALGEKDVLPHALAQ